MSSDSWSQISAVFGTLLERPAGARRRALEAVADPEVRAEVAALLDIHDSLVGSDSGFLETLDSARAGILLTPSTDPEDEPASVGRYRILRRLARGGMGIVYLAHDPTLDRRVALKLLPPYLSGDTAAIGQLTAEARAASALDNPHVQTVYEIGDSGDGRVFIAMAYYDGETLRELITRGPLPRADLIDLGTQLAEGLAAAHRAGIIHRDIKPENVLVTGDRVLKIVDFGVAKVARGGRASVGLPLGTAAYMSPEQTRGEPLDHRTDLWSMGVVLYEMITGTRPFRGQSEALIHEIRGDSPSPPKGPLSDEAAPLGAVVMRCLEKDPERRYPSAEAVAADLRSAAGEPAPDRAPRATGRRVGGRLSWFLVSAAVVTVLLTALFRHDRDPAPPSGTETEAAPGIAVLPFDVRGEDPGVWREGMVDLLSLGLDGAAGLRTIASRTVLARWREAASDTVALDLPRSLAVARTAGARYAVMGSVVSTGHGLRLSAGIYDLEGAGPLGSVQVDGSPDSLFVMVDRLAIGLLSTIWQGKEQPRLERDLSRMTTASLPALKAFLEGERLLRRAEFPAAASAYEQAVAADSTFAFALFHLGVAYGWIGDVPHQNLSFGRALRHGSHLPEREALLFRAAVGYYTMRADLPTTVGLLHQALRQYPDEADAWYLLGDIYFHGGDQVLVSRSKSEWAFRKVIELDPGFGPAYLHLTQNAFLSVPDSAAAAQFIQAYHRLAPGSSKDQMNQIAIGLAFGSPPGRSQALAALDTLTTDDLIDLSEYLDHPHFWRLRDTVLAGHPSSESSPFLTAYLVCNSLRLGRLRAVLSYLEDMRAYPGFQSAGLYQLRSAGIAIPDTDIPDARSLARVTSSVTDIQRVIATFYKGVEAAERLHWDDFADALRRLHEAHTSLLVGGDSTLARFILGTTRGLEGFGLWRRGETEQALSLLMEAQRQTTWVESLTFGALNATIRRWLGEMLLQLDRPREAVVYFESFWNDPLMADRLGPLYEQLGDSLKARAAYTLVADAWRNGDPEMQTRARAAQAAAQRLSRQISD